MFRIYRQPDVVFCITLLAGAGSVWIYDFCCNTNYVPAMFIVLLCISYLWGRLCSHAWCYLLQFQRIVPADAKGRKNAFDWLMLVLGFPFYLPIGSKWYSLPAFAVYWLGVAFGERIERGASEGRQI